MIFVCYDQPEHETEGEICIAWKCNWLNLVFFFHWPFQIDFLEDFRIVWEDTEDDGTRKKSPKKVKKGNLQPNPKKVWQTPSKDKVVTNASKLETI